MYVLSQEPHWRCLKTVTISVKDKDMTSGPWKNIRIDAQSSLLHPMPLPLGGVVVIGYETIGYYNKDTQHVLDQPTIKVPLFDILSWIKKKNSTRNL